MADFGNSNDANEALLHHDSVETEEREPRELKEMVKAIEIGGMNAVQVEEVMRRYLIDLEINPDDTMGLSFANELAVAFIKHATVLCSEQPRRHVDEASNSLSSQEGDLFALLSDDLLYEGFSFLGKGHFLYVGTTCKRFKKVYLKDNVRNKVTSYENAAWSVSCAKMCLKESDEKQNSFETIAKMAGKQGRVKVVEWIHSHEKLSCDPFEYLEMAAHSGQLKVLEWAEKNGIFQDDRSARGKVAKVAMFAAGSGQVKVLDFMHTHDLEIPSCFVCHHACESGQVTVLEWMKERHLLNESEEEYYDFAVCGGQVNVLDWLYDNGFEVDLTKIVYDCFLYKKLQVLLWAWRHGVELEENHYAAVFVYAVDDDLDLLQGLLEFEECPWGNEIIEHAQATGNQRVVNWAVEKGWLAVHHQVL